MSENRWGDQPTSQSYPAALPPVPAEPPRVGFAEGPAFEVPQAGADGDRPHRRPRRRLRTVGLLAAVAIVAGVAGGTGAGLLFHDGSSTPAAASSATAASGASLSKAAQGSISAIAAAVKPSTVEITVTTQSGTDTGSGIILTADGEILTNNHVVSDAADGGGTVKVTFSDGRTATASVLGSKASHDLALIKAKNVSGLKAASLGDSSKVAIGDQVVAIGSPEGLTGTVTSGIVSALNRTVTVASSSSGSGGFDGQLPRNWYDQQYGNGNSGNSGNSGGSNGSGSGTVSYKAIQTDAAINPGNSGGPLINSAGQIVGINSAMYSSSGSSGSDSSAGSVGLGFAIPINDAKALISQMESSGSA